jgi:DNA-directed RNA polymerase alpha subunit
MDSDHMTRLASLLEESANALRQAAEFQLRICPKFPLVEAGDSINEEVLNTSIHDLGFSFRIRSRLSDADIETVRDLLRLRVQNLLEIPHMGRVSVQQIQEKLSKFGLKIKGL